MIKEDVKLFNILSRKLCDELKNDDRCMDCPFYQWDTYFNCFNEDNCDYPLSLKENDKE